jgi:protein-disulfide isomerase
VKPQTRRTRWKPKDAVSRLFTVTLILGAVVVVALNARRELIVPPDGNGFRQGMEVDGWQELAGSRQGPPDEISILVFGDYTCPYCRTLDAALDTLRSTLGPRVGIQHLHFPLHLDGAGFDAAMSVECAAIQERGQALHRVLYEHQEALGVVAWDSLGVLAGVPDPDAFRACIGERRTAGRVEDARRRAEGIGVEVTPTFLINGRLYIGSPPYAELAARVARISGDPAVP